MRIHVLQFSCTTRLFVERVNNLFAASVTELDRDDKIPAPGEAKELNRLVAKQRIRQIHGGGKMLTGILQIIRKR